MADSFESAGKGEIALLEHAEALADEAFAPKPDGLDWGLKAVQSDLRTYDDYRWPWPSNWAECLAADIDEKNLNACPSKPGDGLCVAKLWQGMRYARVPSKTLLLVGYDPAEVLGEDEEKVRVRRAFVRYVIDGERLIREHGLGANLKYALLRFANLEGADLRGAKLRGADLRGADLSFAELGGANLKSADLEGADLEGADLSFANLSFANLGGANLGGANFRDVVYDHSTRWPTDFDFQRADGDKNDRHIRKK